MKEHFGTLPNGKVATLYWISNGSLRAQITDLGATLVRLLVPSKQGSHTDVVLGCSNVDDYIRHDSHLGATIGRNANRVRNAGFSLGNARISLGINDGNNNLHSGPDYYDIRIWDVAEHTENSITFSLLSPDGDQGFPGNAQVSVKYVLEDTALKIMYDGVCDKDTVFNMTNHSYFNLAGHENTAQALEQTLQMPSDFFTVADNESIPVGELRNVAGTPMDFRTAKPIGRDINKPYEPLILQRGYDHNYVISKQPCAVLSSQDSGITMQVFTDCPGIQVYSGNYLNEMGKDGVFYGERSGIALETQFFPDSVNHSEWKQPFVPAHTPYHSETVYQFTL